MVSTNGEICHTIKLLDLWKKSYGVTIQNNETSLGPLVNKNPYTVLFISKEFTTRNLIYTIFFLVHFFALTSIRNERINITSFWNRHKTV